MTITPTTGAEMPEALLPCPYCGSSEVHIADDLITFLGECLTCGASSSISAYRAQAVSSWNRRAALSAAAPAAPADLITIRKPTTRAEVEWLAKLAHLLVSDVNDTLQRVLDGAPQSQQPTAPQAGAPESETADVLRGLYDAANREAPGPTLLAITNAIQHLQAVAPQAGAESYPPLPVGIMDTLRRFAHNETWGAAEEMLHSAMKRYADATVALRARGAVPDADVLGAEAAEWIGGAERGRINTTVGRLGGAVAEAIRKHAAPAAVSAPSVPIVAWKWRRHGVDKWTCVGFWDSIEAMAAQEMEERGWEVVRLVAAPQAQAHCARCNGCGDDPEGFYDQSRGPDGDTHDGPCRTCNGSGCAPQAPAGEGSKA